MEEFKMVKWLEELNDAVEDRKRWSEEQRVRYVDAQNKANEERLKWDKLLEGVKNAEERLNTAKLFYLHSEQGTP